MSSRKKKPQPTPEFSSREPTPLPLSFYDRPTLTVARELLGKNLIVNNGTQWRSLQINEVEAYDGLKDKACHAHCGRTKRSEVLFGPPGHWYVYLCYGIHWLANLVTGPVNYPAAVLLRGAHEYDGPGKLTKGVGMTGAINRLPVTPKCGFFVADGPRIPRTRVKRTPRIGIDYAGPVWSQKPYRFLLT
jgi:DNA-3-methyladenine glycosylase